MSGEDKLTEYERRLRETAKTQTTHVSGFGKMHVEGTGDISISGSGSVSPDEVRISGSARIPSGLKTKRMICAGSISVDGDIEAEEMRFSGSATVHGTITTKTLSTSGSLDVGGEIKGSTVEAAGSFGVGKKMMLEDTLWVHGFLKVKEDVNVEKLVKLRGGFDIYGRILTRNFEARLRRVESHARNGIEATSVDIRKRENRGSIFFGIPFLGTIFREGRLYTTDIVAKERVYLENVTCENVSGGIVVLGEGCVVSGKVQYSESVSTDSRVRLTGSPQKVSSK